MFHWTGSSSQTATGDMILSVLKGLCHQGASLTVPYGRGRFFPSSHTSCPTFQDNAGTSILYATWLRACIARRQFCRMFERYSSAVWFLDCIHCCVNSGGSQPINNSFVLISGDEVGVLFDPLVHLF
jgi:hypothetical protein